MWHTKNAIDILICVCVKNVYYSECKLFLKLKWHMISNLTSMKLLFKIHHTTRTHTHTHIHTDIHIHVRMIKKRIQVKKRQIIDQKWQYIKVWVLTVFWDNVVLGILVWMINICHVRVANVALILKRNTYLLSKKFIM